MVGHPCHVSMSAGLQGITIVEEVSWLVLCAILIIQESLPSWARFVAPCKSFYKRSPIFGQYRSTPPGPSTSSSRFFLPPFRIQRNLMLYCSVCSEHSSTLHCWVEIIRTKWFPQKVRIHLFRRCLDDIFVIAIDFGLGVAVFQLVVLTSRKMSPISSSCPFHSIKTVSVSFCRFLLSAELDQHLSEPWNSLNSILKRNTFCFRGA